MTRKREAMASLLLRYVFKVICSFKVEIIKRVCYTYHENKIEKERGNF